MRILHSSDWHIGNQLHEEARDQEFASWAAWLIETLKNEHVECLLVSGDIFDVRSPSREAQRSYFDIMTQLATLAREGGELKHVLFISGNHDSATQLQVGAGILEYLGVHVISQFDRLQPGKNVLTLSGTQFIALPYIEGPELVENFYALPHEQRAHACEQGLKETMSACTQIAQQRGGAIIAMAHLYIHGTPLGESEHDLSERRSLGNLDGFHDHIFPAAIDYVALGHIHRPYAIGGNPTRRYCGAPLPMAFDELKHARHVIIADVEPGKVEISKIDIPLFVPMYMVDEATEEAVLTCVKQLTSQAPATGAPLRYKVRCAEPVPAGVLGQKLEELTANINMKRLGKIEIAAPSNAAEQKLTHRASDFRQLSPEAVFKEMLNRQGLADDAVERYTALFQQALRPQQ